MFARSILVLSLLSLMNLVVDSVRTTHLPNAMHQNMKIEEADSSVGNDIKLVLELLKSQGHKIASLEKKLNIRDETMKHQDEMINDLKKTVEDQSHEIHELSSDMNKKRMEIKIVQNNVKKLRRKLFDRSKGYQEIENGLFKDLHDNNNHVERKEKASDTTEKGTPKVLEKSYVNDREIAEASISRRAVSHVSFSVYLSHLTYHLGEHQPVKFDGIVTNDGNGYNPHTGAFTIPVSGTYMFIFYVSSSTSGVTFDLMVDDVLEASGVARPAIVGHSKDVQGGSAVILKLNQGASVWIENHYNNGEVYSTNTSRWVSFSGFLLY